MRWLLVILLIPAMASADSAGVLDPWVQAIGTETPPAALLGSDKSRITYQERGIPAPYEGVLLDITTSTQWTLRLNWYQLQLQRDTALLRDIMAAQHATQLQLRLDHKLSYEREIKGLREDLKQQAKEFARAQKVPFYKTWGFGAVCGTIFGVAVAGLLSWTAAQ